MLNKIGLNSFNYVQKANNPTFKGRTCIRYGETRKGPVKDEMVINYGTIEGPVEAKENVINSGKVIGDITAKGFYSQRDGEVIGNITAHKVKLEDSPHVKGNITITDDGDKEGKFTLWYVDKGETELDGEVIYLDKNGNIKRKAKYEHGHIKETYTEPKKMTAEEKAERAAKIAKMQEFVKKSSSQDPW